MEHLIIPIVGMLIPIVIVPTAIAFKHARRVRELEHAERMRAMDLGLLPGSPTLNWPAAFLCGAVGAGVPIGAFLVTWFATLTAEVPNEIWVAPVVVSFSAVGSARKLASRLIETRDRHSASSTSNVEKPAYDPDAYDVVGSRG